ncbi:PLP-dependent aminotransferase family protein [Rodentibacter caecimuris]|uniref:MocR-like pyridoxine biosynthesis transcription factor PdxR n=1 Tax=Rodentibacter caecimuris TaxID=1796644 RepID=UPI0015C39710
MKKLSYQLDKSLKLPLYLQLYQQIKNAIHHQSLLYGERLPSKRQLCDYLQISQNTVESAYAQLLAEGYIESKARKGFFVCFKAELEFNLKTSLPEPQITHVKLPIKFDLNPDKIDSNHFPLQIWRKCGRNNFGFQGKSWLNLGDSPGDWNLRYEIANYLSASRGVQCDVEQIIICAGVESCLQQLILLFDNCYSHSILRYAMESYGYSKVEALLQSYEKKIIKLPIEKNTLKLDLNVLNKYAVNIAYLTPSHLYPFGQVLSISQRQQLLEWVNLQPDRFIIEDDYDSEFRYKGKPIPALQSLDCNEKVIYLGSFSKLIMPSLRMTFMVLPKRLLPIYQKYCGFFHSSVSRFEQQRLACFISSGEFEKHIHRMRKIYRKKMELICRILTPYREKIRYYGEYSGFYLLIELINESRASEMLTARALEVGVKVYPINYDQRILFSIGFGDLTEEQLEQAMNILLVVWEI